MSGISPTTGLSATGSSSSSSSGTGLPNVTVPSGFTLATALAKWRGGLAKVRSATSNARIICIGDSTTFGAFSNAGTDTGDLKANAYPAALSALLNSAGIAATANSFCGNGSNAFETNLANDARISKTGAWVSASSSQQYSIGGPSLKSPNSASTLAFHPSVQCDTFVVWYKRLNGAATFNVDINGGTPNVVNSANASTALLSSTITATLGDNTCNLTWVSGGTINIVAIEGYNSAVTSVQVMNGGWPGAASADFAQAQGAPWDPDLAPGVIGADLIILNNGINDWDNSVALATYQTNMQTLITAFKVTSDVILVGPNPTQVGISVPTQLTYIAVLQSLAQSNGLIFIDVFDRFVDYPTANTVGLMGDTKHPNQNGYMDIAGLIKNVLLTA